MIHKQETELKQTLNDQVKTLHNLLCDLDPKERIQYIKEMLPKLLSFPKPAQSAREKLEEQLRKESQPLSDKELDIINEMAEKTERLYKAMNDDGHFG